VRALYYDGQGGVEWREDPAPELADPGDALVRPVAVTTCDLDQAILRSAVPGSERPFPIGHEGVGEVVAVGDAVSGVAVGDTVAIPYHLSCGACDRCRQGVPLYCRATASDGLAVFGLPVGGERGGLFSDLVRVPHATHSLVPLPAGVTPLQAVSVGDNLTDAWRVVAPHLKARPGSEVLVLSTCPTGVLAAAVAIAYGASRVRFADRDAGRLALSESLGAEAQELGEPLPADGDFHIVVNATDSKSALHDALLATAPGGICESMAFHFSDVPLPLLAMHLRCVTFRSSLCNARLHMPEVLALLASGRIDPEIVRTDLLRFETAADTLVGAGEKPVYVR
jgi:alcohol dehydrogenase